MTITYVWKGCGRFQWRLRSHPYLWRARILERRAECHHARSAQREDGSWPQGRKWVRSGPGHALAPWPLNTVMATQYELAPGSESEPAATTDCLKDKPCSLTRRTPTHQQAVHKPATPTSGPLPVRGGVSRLAGRAWIRTHVCNGNPRAKGARGPRMVGSQDVRTQSIQRVLSPLNLGHWP